MSNNSHLLDMVAHQKAGRPAGIYSICSAQRFVLEAAMLQARMDKSPILIEATSNQVDQFGGYTGMTPMQFVDYVAQIGKDVDFPIEKVILGGDHLGPNAWQSENAADAMEKARVLVRAYALAGFIKIHLDTSMRCADDPGEKNTPLDIQISAERTAELCSIVESTCKSRLKKSKKPLYIIGTEVPVPGGAQDKLCEPQVTSVEDVQNTIEVTKQAFLARDLQSAWDRVIAVVVQPGIEFNNSQVIDYDRTKTELLSRFIANYKQLVFEVHSSDYQTKTVLRNLVENQFAILKVGPWLTYAFREAIFALDAIDKKMFAGKRGMSPTRFRRTLDRMMCSDPQYWQRYYHGCDTEKRVLRKYSFSDRSRYYWSQTDVIKSLRRLLDNLTRYPIPLTLLSQYLPVQYHAVREGIITTKPSDLIHHKIMEIIGFYSSACSIGVS